VLFAGGGTGGHIIPGAAVAEELTALLPSSRCLFLMSDRRSERQCQPALRAFETAEIPATPWARPLDKLRFPVQSMWAAERVLLTMRRFRPHVVVGLGSYNSVVPVLLARMLGIKSLVIEANAVPGRAVRALAPFADCIAAQWRNGTNSLRARQLLIAGSPVRTRLLQTNRETARRRLGLRPDGCTLLAMGGSQGALPLNRLLTGALRLARHRRVDVQTLHLTGVDHLPQALRARQRLGAGYRPIGFLDRIEEAFAAADFAFCRAGASTLAYLTAAGVPAILVPYPYHADKQQEANARVLADAGAALLIRQDELDEHRLADLIEHMALDERLRGQMAEAARRLGRPRAAHDVAAQVAALAGFSVLAHDSATDTSTDSWRSSRAA